MQESSQQQLEKLTPILRIVKVREELYLQLMNFVAKNIESSSSQHEQLSLFGKFLQATKLSESEIIPEEKRLLAHFDTQSENMTMSEESATIVRHVIKNNKQLISYHRQILRLCSRLIEILEASIAKTRKSIFNENGRLSLQFTRFKRNLHSVVKGQTVHLGEFTSHILNYVRIKYKKQVAKVEKYIFKLESGAMIALRDLYFNDNSDVSSADQRQTQTYRTRKQSVRKMEHNSSTESPTKRTSLKKTLKSSKKGHKLLKSTKRQMKDSSVNSDVKPPKQLTASKLLKFYGMLQLSKREFLEDFIFQKNNEQQHRKKMMNNLLQKNKAISTQISGYYKKSLTYLSKIKEIEVNNYLRSSGQEKQKSKSKDRHQYDSDDHGSVMMKNSSLRKSFVISKRKSSLNFQKSSKILTQNDQGKLDMNKTVKNLPNRRKSSAQTPQRPQNKSKKLFVIKSPVMFQDDNIPQAPQLGTGAGWFRAPLSNRKTQKKGDNIRLKRRNNPLPMEKSLFSESFKFTDHKL